MRQKLSARTIAIVVLAILATAFTVMNRGTVVNVWPFGAHSILLVMFVCLALGVGIGVLGHSILGMVRPRAVALEGEPRGIQAGERPHPGRP